MNSGFMQIPNCFPACLPEVRSRRGKIVFSTVPGSTVLRMTTTWNLSVFRNDWPIWPITLSTCASPKLPFSLLGIPTQTKETSPGSFAFVRACNRAVLTPRRISSSKPGSIIGLLPELMKDTLVSCGSTPVTTCPISARHAAVTQPTYPIPKTVIFIEGLATEISLLERSSHEQKTEPLLLVWYSRKRPHSAGSRIREVLDNK